MTGRKQERYDSLDGLRALGAVGIVAHHVYANGKFGTFSLWTGRMLLSWTDLVFLFMIVSGFSLCCGYFEKLTEGKTSVSEFYGKRFRKTLPFFALLVMLDFLMSPGWGALAEVFANLTLCFGLLPNAQIQVIGVGWTLGLIFVFYLLFPFFCYLLSDRKRAWIGYAACIAMHFLCRYYFFDADHVSAGFQGRANILYSGVFFYTGGMLYLYRGVLTQYAKKLKWILPAVGLTLWVVLCLIPGTEPIGLLAAYSLFIVYALGRGRKKGLLKNRLTGILASVSMEIYLCHMIFYRVAEKLGMPGWIPVTWLSYAVAVLIILIGATVFAFVYQNVLEPGASRAWEWIKDKIKGLSQEPEEI